MSSHFFTIPPALCIPFFSLPHLPSNKQPTTCKSVDRRHTPWLRGPHSVISISSDEESIDEGAGDESEAYSEINEESGNESSEYSASLYNESDGNSEIVAVGHYSEEDHPEYFPMHQSPFGEESEYDNTGGDLEEEFADHFASDHFAPDHFAPDHFTPDHFAPDNDPSKEGREISNEESSSDDEPLIEVQRPRNEAKAARTIDRAGEERIPENSSSFDEQLIIETHKQWLEKRKLANDDDTQNSEFPDIHSSSDNEPITPFLQRRRKETRMTGARKPNDPVCIGNCLQT